MATIRFANREQAGRQLAASLRHYRGRSDLIVLALPRGGVPVAAEVAAELDAPLDLLLVRKLGMPGQEELAIGAIASGGAIVFNEDLLRMLPVGEESVARIRIREEAELARREQAYRGDRPAPAIGGKTVILVDDGLATGATMRAAVAALEKLSPARVVVAVPVAPPETVEVLEREADEVVCLLTREPFYGVGYWYEDFSQTSDEEVKALLAQAWQQPQQRSSSPEE